MIRQPICMYNNWSSYDELSDNVILTEELAMQELDEILRLRKSGVRMDYYLMDAFWFALDGGYRQWRKPHWPGGPDRWLDKCIENNIKPGLWVSTNTLCNINAAPEWEDSLDESRTSMCMFKGGFLRHFMDTLQMWYDRGVRAYKFDFVHFGAATPDVVKTHLPEEIIARNIAALKSALKVFRYNNPDVLLLAYNGFGGDQENTSTPFRKCYDTDWLTVFDSLYCGDPRPSDVPAMDFWRSMDIYSDHMVRAHEATDIPLERTDNTAFMIGKTGTCCHRKTAAWKGMLILTLARGGWMNVYYGNLELLSDNDAKWFAKAQSIYLKLQGMGRIYTFGGIPGKGEPYGYAGLNGTGSVYTVVNPSQSIMNIEMPIVSDLQEELANGNILFTDAGFEPKLKGNVLTLGPEQMAVVGFGGYASDEFDLGIQEDVVIPKDISQIPAEFEQAGHNSISAVIEAPGNDLRITFQQFRNGKAHRFSGGAPPNGTPLDKMLQISVKQQDRELAVVHNYGKAIWSGLSWAAGEVKKGDLTPGEPITITLTSTERGDVTMEGCVYIVKYS